MSVRAYRLIRKETADQSSFSIWHDTDLLDFFREADPDGLVEQWTEDGVGTLEVSVKALEKAIASFPWGKDDYRIEAIKADIAFAKEQGDEYVLYECF